MRIFLLFSMLVAFTASADERRALPPASDLILAYPGCYQGTLKVLTSRERSEERAVRLVFSGRRNDSGERLFVHELSLGDARIPYSGRLAAANTLEFNDNDDYIPGGNATYNRDIRLEFTARGASGTYELRAYPDESGRGGYGDTAGDLVERGLIQLRAMKRCAD
jgi:hypothetical protein